MTKVKVLKLSEFIDSMIAIAKASHQEELNINPIAVQKAYEAAYPNLPKKAGSTYRMALQRKGLTDAKRKEVTKELRNNQAQQDIEAYSKVKSYISGAKRDGVQQTQIDNQLSNFRKLWELMGKTNPEEWSEEQVMDKIMTAYPMRLDDRGRNVFAAPSAIKSLLSPLSTMYSGILRKNWSANLCQHKAGELKDFFMFYEFSEFASQLKDTEALSVEGWQSIFRAHINMGSREGTNGKTGVLGLLWEDINFQTRRCSLREKGHRGNAGERWENVPLDLFGWLHGWEWLIKFWKQQGNPTKGKVFPIAYSTYNTMFSETRHKCQSRISQDTDAMRLHIFRRTHGQWCRRLGVPLEFICGDAPNGRYGIGWKDPKIPVRYYLTQESEYIDSRELEFMTNNPEYQGVLRAMNESNEKQKQWLGLK